MLFAALAAGACSQAMPSDAKTDGVQRIEITESLLRNGGADTLRFGRLHSGETAVKSFILHNATSAPVVIIRSDKSCNCASMEFTRRPVMAGDETAVVCTFDTRGEYGWQFKLIKLWLSGAEEPLRIFIEAEVE